jgi:hypothetical protein
MGAALRKRIEQLRNAAPIGLRSVGWSVPRLRPGLLQVFCPGNISIILRQP